MKKSLTLICVAVLLCVCVSVEAEDIPARPGAWGITPGYYTTYAGTLLLGRMSESWLGDSLDFFVSGNVISIMSWDGNSLGSQWRIWDVIVDSEGAVMTNEVIDTSGTGYIDYTIGCIGGWVWFDDTHFGDGMIGLGGWISYMHIDARASYWADTLICVTSNIHINGNFNYCPGCKFEIRVQNAMTYLYPEAPAPVPEEYPEFSAGTENGCYWDVCCVLVAIACGNGIGGIYDEPYCIQIGVESSSWGKIKSMHR
jgi:hypothetical protein